MAFDPASLTDYSFTEIKLAAKHAMISAAVGGANFTINGRELGRITPDQAMRLYNWAAEMEEAEIVAEEDTSGGFALVQYGERM